MKRFFGENTKIKCIRFLGKILKSNLDFLGKYQNKIYIFGKNTEIKFRCFLGKCIVTMAFTQRLSCFSMDVVPVLCSEMLQEFSVLLGHSPQPIGSTRLLQLMAINMFAIDNSAARTGA